MYLIYKQIFVYRVVLKAFDWFSSHAMNLWPVSKATLT